MSVCPFPPGQPASFLCLASSSLILWVRRPVLPRGGQTATGKHRSWPSSRSRVEGVKPSFACQNVCLPTSSLNKSQLHLCPKR